MHICTVVPISKTIGANRIVPAIGIPAQSEKIRRELVERGLTALQTPVTGQTVFE